MSSSGRTVFWTVGILTLGALVVWLVSKLVELDHMFAVAFEDRKCNRFALDEISGLAATYRKVKGRPPASISEAEEWSKREAGTTLRFEPKCEIHDIRLIDKGSSFEISFKARGRFVKEAKGEYQWDEKGLTKGWLSAYEMMQSQKKH